MGYGMYVYVLLNESLKLLFKFSQMNNEMYKKKLRVKVPIYYINERDGAQAFQLYRRQQKIHKGIVKKWIFQISKNLHNNCKRYICIVILIRNKEFLEKKKNAVLI